MKVLGAPQATPEQLKIIGDTRTGVEIIRGAAGSGKTTTALLRLRNLSAMFKARHQRLSINNPVSALVLTYNRTLCGYVEALAQAQAQVDTSISISVQTYAQWARGFSSDLLIREDRMSMIAELARNEGLTFAPNFLASEIEYVLGRFALGTFDRYLEAERTGRGIAPRVERPNREKILRVIAGYRSKLRGMGMVDWEDWPNIVEAAPSQNHQIVIVDEAQDFSANQIRSIRHHLAQVHALTLVIDTAQRLYPRGYTWAEAGIEARSANFYRLAQNHRNTTQIAAFAQGIMQGLTLDDDATLPDFQAASRQGPLPEIIIGRYDAQLKYALSKLKNSVDLNKESVGFLKPLGGGWFETLKDGLTYKGFDFEEITRQRKWTNGPENIALSTMHSAKGLEFDHVIILGLNAQVTPHGAEENDDQLLTLRRLLAMAVSRARKSVLIGYKKEEASQLVNFFKSGTYTQQDV